jgi:hypothetical protein
MSFPQDYSHQYKFKQSNAFNIELEKEKKSLVA